MFHFIVEFASGTELDRREHLIAAHGGTFENHLFGDFSLITIDSDGTAGLLAEDEVINVELDGEVQPKAQVTDYSLNVTRVLTHGHRRGYTGKGIKVCVIDTGFTPAHEDLRGLVTKYCRIEGGIIKSENNAAACADPNGHGTAVAATIMMQDNSVGFIGSAPGTELFVVKGTEGDSGSMTYSSMAKAIEWAVKNGADVVNISFSQDYTSSVVKAVCTHAYNNNRTVVAAAGNEGLDTEFYGEMTAADQVGMWKVYPGVLTIGAVKNGGNNTAVRAEYSSKGTGIDFVAPSNIALADSAYNSAYSRMAGTSFAAPFLAGMVAVIRERFPGITVDQIYEFLVEHCFQIGNGEEEYYGHGMPVLPDLSLAFPAYEEVATPEPAPQPEPTPEPVAFGYHQGQRITSAILNGQAVRCV